MPREALRQAESKSCVVGRRAGSVGGRGGVGGAVSLRMSQVVSTRARGTARQAWSCSLLC